jgi:hypothetical protein
MSDDIIRTIVDKYNQEQNESKAPPPYSLVDDAATQLLQTFETNLAAMTIEELGTKIRENGLKLKVFKPGQSKTGRLTLLIDAFNKYCNDIKNMNRAELFDICRDNKISGYSGLKKDELVQIILELTASCKQIKFADKVADNKSTDKVVVADNKSTDKKTSVADNTTDSNAFISELELMKKKLDDQIEKEKERVEKERVEKENLKLEQERLKAEKAQKDKAEQQKVKAEQQKVKADQQKVKADAQIITDEDPDKKKKKQTIPKSVKTHVWDLYIGKHINEHRCLCCKKSYIQITNFDTGHVLSEKDGGTHEISNLRPICAVCNHSMGSENMIDFVKRYGYYIG